MLLSVRSIFSLLIFLGCFQAVLNPLRLLSIFNMAYINLFIIYLAGLICFFYYLLRVRMITLIELLMVALVLAGLTYALSTENDHFKTFTSFIRPLFFLAVVKVFSFGTHNNENNIVKVSDANALLASYLIGVSVVGFIYFTIGGIRASATAIALALPFFFFFLNKNYVRAAFCVFLFLIGGKLGPFVGVLVALSLILLSSLKRVLFLTAASVTLGLFVLAITYLTNIDFLRIPVLAKLNIDVIFDGDISAYKLDRFVLGGRLSEAYSAIEGISPSYGLLHWVFGGGLGYTYLWTDFNDVVIREANSGVHFSPLAVFCVYGLPFSLLLFLYFGKYLFHSILILLSRGKNSVATVMWAAFFVASCVNALTAYSLFTNLMMAVSLGFLQQSIRNKKTRINQRTFINTQIIQESI
jgi:hypothetical protein